MMRRMIYKLRNKKGETITETLVGVLIVGMGTAILVTGITTALKINQKTKEMSTKNAFSYTEPEESEPPVKFLVVKMKVKDESATWDTIIIPVSVYKDTANGNDYVWFVAEP